MSITHACAIDAHSTAIASVARDTADGYTITECKTMQTGIGEYAGTNGDRAASRLVSLLRKKKIDTITLSIQTPRFFPLDTVFSRNISDRAFDTHCKAEASFLLNKPGEYLHDHIPYTLSSEHDHVRRHLLFYYPSDLYEAVHDRLRSFCSISSGAYYLKPMILSLAVTFQPFILLELENEYVTLSAGSNGELEYFSYWQLNHSSDAEYFALRELTANRESRRYPVHITGNLAVEKPLHERISRETGTDLHPFSIVELFSMQRSVRSPCNSPIELKALSAALVELSAFP